MTEDGTAVPTPSRHGTGTPGGPALPRDGRRGNGRMGRGLLAVAAACAVAFAEPGAQAHTGALPPMRVPVAAPPPAPSRPNSEIARDILDLAFALESGRALPGLGRFEGPVRLRVAGPATPTLGAELARLVARLRAEAGLEVSFAEAGPAEIAVEAVPAAALSREAPGAACFVVPGASSWAEFLAGRGAPGQDWARVTVRTRAAVFLPAEAPPQELRDCLHEEVAQALGPLNDLYRLPDSVFNDDNVQGALTGFDMLALRVLNDPELSAGMTRAEVAARLPALLARLNPGGEAAAGESGLGVSAAWAEAMGTALARREPEARRRAAAQSAVGTAAEPVARGLALVALGRTEAGRDPEAARAAFDAAEATLAGRPATELHAAQAALQLSALALRQGDGARAAAAAGPAAAVAQAHGDARLLATLLFLRAEGLDLTGDATAAEAARLDGLAWARYGFGDEGAWARLDEVRTLVPDAAEGGGA